MDVNAHRSCFQLILDWHVGEPKNFASYFGTVATNSRQALKYRSQHYFPIILIPSRQPPIQGRPSFLPCKLRRHQARLWLLILLFRRSLSILWSRMGSMAKWRLRLLTWSWLHGTKVSMRFREGRSMSIIKIWHTLAPCKRNDPIPKVGTNTRSWEGVS